ncbi:hypothetical protein SK571_36740 [Lentzea sp. BCCO 10_0798]|uniref:Uncharacterized protein n=1 Tax=Lentzea kristufekii TaxID=3095430 RepID=A0ABU4U2Z9_9PSEU|nr:hypothetical protein [Lentzea sp. BCCO 10_0798]MDX8054951.1 hypothetical protein [Lentzea sp. BCCO 10_0798]
MFQPYLAEYRYYALFEDGHGMSDVANAEGLYRSIGVHDEQKYDGHGVWTRSDGLSRAGDRDSYDISRCHCCRASVTSWRRSSSSSRPGGEPSRWTVTSTSPCSTA